MRNAQKSDASALESRLAWISEILQFDEEEATILGMIARVSLFDTWRELTQTVPFKASNTTCELLALVTGLSPIAVDERLAPGSRLVSSGLVIDEADGEYCASRMLLRIARCQVTAPDLLRARIMPKAEPSSLSWEDFEHIGPLRNLSQRAIASGQPVSILLHGRPGTGKTEFARLLADRTARRAVFAGLADEQGGEPARCERLAHLNLLRALTRQTCDSLIVVDEADDVLVHLEGRPDSGSKQWLNRLVEERSAPTIWILNDPSRIDPALVRRMNLAIAFDTPPLPSRVRIATRAAAAQDLVLADTELAKLASLDAEPAIIASGMQIARLASGGAAEALLGTQSVLKALGRQRRSETRPDACYDFSLAAADCDLELLARQLAEAPERGWSLLLAGPSGTGKSAFARHVARHLGIEVVEKRGSDLLDAYVGETERRIAAAFGGAADRGAMLLIDEADSFLFRREAGQRSWETGMVNEMLRWMEHPRTPFVATTNLADRLDPAMQRRFTLRVNFSALSPRQARAHFAARFGLAPPADDKVMIDLTPGDFAAVHQRARLLNEWRPTVLAEWLEAEVALRGETCRPIGFHAVELPMWERASIEHTVQPRQSELLQRA